MRKAAERGHVDTVKAFIADGRASASEPANDPPISRVSYNGHLEVVKLRIDHGADPLAKDSASLKMALEKNKCRNWCYSHRRKAQTCDGVLAYLPNGRLQDGSVLCQLLPCDYRRWRSKDQLP